MEFRVDEHLVIVEYQRRNVGEQTHREDIGGEQPLDFVVHEPLHDQIQREERPRERNDADQHCKVARHARPSEDVEVGNRDEKKQNIADEEPSLLFGGSPTHEKIQ